VKLLKVLSTKDLILPVKIIFIAGDQQAMAMIAAKAVGVVTTIAGRSDKEFIFGKRFLTFGTF
jgi:hypothetical protein